MPVVQAEQLTVAYGASPAVRDVSLALAEGEIAGLLGVSGSGKSTLARALLGRLPPGARIARGRVERNGAAALIPQEPALSLSPFLRAGDQIRHCAAARAIPAGNAELAALLAQLGLPDPERILGAYPHQLSGGQRQRVAWAQALVQRPALLLADEPTTALDSMRQRELVSLVNTAVSARGCAVLWISHDPALLGAVASRILVMDAGRLVEDGPTPEVLASPGSAILQRLLEATR